MKDPRLWVLETRFRKITFTYSTKIKTVYRGDFNSHLYA